MDLKVIISPGLPSFIIWRWSRRSQYPVLPLATTNQQIQYYHPQTGFVFSVRLPFEAWIVDHPGFLSELPHILKGFKDLRQVTVVLCPKGGLENFRDPGLKLSLAEVRRMFRGQMKNIYDCCRAIANFWSLNVFVNNKEVLLEDLLR